MKAWLCRSLDGIDAMRLEEVAPPDLRPGTVRIRLRAAALNFPDLLMPAGRYQVRPDLPFVPGLEGMGEVAEVAPDVDPFTVGQRVMSYAGQGCFAEEAVVPAGLVHPVPDGMSDAAAAGFVLAYGTAWHALVDRGRLRDGECVLVLGAAGGVGLPALEIAAARGCTVIAAAGSEEKRQACLAHGARHVLDSRGDLRAQLREGGFDGRIDIVYDPVGGAATEPALRSLDRYGRLLVVGFAAGDIPALRANLLLLKQADAVGVSFRQFAQDLPAQASKAVSALAALFGAGRLAPRIARELPLADLPAAAALLQDRAVVGKVVLRIAD